MNSNDPAGYRSESTYGCVVPIEPNNHLSMAYQLYIGGEKFKLTLDDLTRREVSGVLRLLAGALERDEILEDAMVLSELGTASHQASTERPSSDPTAVPSVREELLHCCPRTQLQTILVVGHYLHTHEHQRAFTVKKLRSSLMEAGVPLPKQLSVVLSRGVAKGYLATDGRKRWKRHQYYLTEQGHRFVEGMTNRQSPGTN